jgi:hypothetical protein
MAFGAGEGRPRGLALVEEMASAAVAARARSATQPCISAIANKISAALLHPALARRGGFLFLNPAGLIALNAPSAVQNFF